MCKNIHFSKFDYEFFSVALSNKNKDAIKIIFDKIENKVELNQYFVDLLQFFDDDMKEIYNSLFQN
jgi:hypothetical protein